VAQAVRHVQTDDVRRLKQLEAERDLEFEVMKEIAAKKMVSVPARRSAVAYATGRGLSQRRACTLLKVARSALGTARAWRRRTLRFWVG
jgi:hypothetical protein